MGSYRDAENAGLRHIELIIPRPEQELLNLFEAITKGTATWGQTAGKAFKKHKMLVEEKFDYALKDQAAIREAIIEKTKHLAGELEMKGG